MSEWEIVGNNMLVNDDFKNDAALLLSGDWNNEEEMRNFLTDVCNKLNRSAELEAENEKLKEKLEYFSDKNTEYLNELWELKKENARLKSPITPEMVERVEWLTGTAFFNHEITTKNRSQFKADKLNELMEGKDAD